MTELDTAKRSFAQTYFNGVVGIVWEEACDFAEFMAGQFRYNPGQNEPNSDRVVAERLYCEAHRYADM